MELTDAMEFVRSHRRGVLVTQKRDGRPQLSNIAYWVGDDGVIRISITADRAKYKNLQREPVASLHVTREDFYAYAVIDGDVEYYRAVAGEHDDWNDYRQAMVRDRRLIVRLKPTHAYGMLPG